MRLALKPHPDTSDPPAIAIEVELRRPERTRLLLRYSLTGAVSDLLLAAPAAAERRDNLWQQTCFEAFVAEAREEGYREFNFSPSTQWAAYRFDGYRSGMQLAETTPDIAVHLLEDCVTLEAALPLSGAGPWRLGLTAIIEEKGGRKSYWALAHPPGAPDFHHPACFALELPAAEEP